MTVINSPSLFALAAASVILVGCGKLQPQTSHTLYRNSPLDPTLRVKVAAFDADDTADFNGGNCRMVSRLLNSNFIASARAEEKEPTPGLGFWCETGPYSNKGRVPSEFDAAFPTNSDGPFRW